MGQLGQRWHVKRMNAVENSHDFLISNENAQSHSCRKRCFFNNGKGKAIVKKSTLYPSIATSELFVLVFPFFGFNLWRRQNPIHCQRKNVISLLAFMLILLTIWSLNRSGKKKSVLFKWIHGSVQRSNSTNYMANKKVPRLQRNVEFCGKVKIDFSLMA